MWREPDNRPSRLALGRARRIRVVPADTYDLALRTMMPDMADELEFLWEAPLCETGLQHREEITTPC